MSDVISRRSAKTASASVGTMAMQRVSRTRFQRAQCRFRKPSITNWPLQQPPPSSVFHSFDNVHTQPTCRCRTWSTIGRRPGCPPPKCTAPRRRSGSRGTGRCGRCPPPPDPCCPAVFHSAVSFPSRQPIIDHFPDARVQ